MCPSSGAAGDTEVELSTMVYGESTPDYYEELRVGIEYPYYQ